MNIWIRYPSYGIVFSVYKWIIYHYSDRVDSFYIEHLHHDHLSDLLTGDQIHLVPHAGKDIVPQLLLQLLSKDDLIILHPDYPDSISQLLLNKVDCIVTAPCCGGIRVLNSRYLEWNSCFLHKIQIEHCHRWTDIIHEISHHRTIHVTRYDGIIIDDQDGSVRLMDMRYWSDVHHDIMKMNFFLWNRIIENNSLSSDPRIVQDAHRSGQMSMTHTQNPSVGMRAHANYHEDPYTTSFLASHPRSFH